MVDLRKIQPSAYYGRQFVSRWGMPQPPPPGVSIRSTSPAAISNRVLAGSVCGFRPLRSRTYYVPAFPLPRPPTHKPRAPAGPKESSPPPAPESGTRARSHRRRDARLARQNSCAHGSSRCAPDTGARTPPPEYSSYWSCAYAWRCTRRLSPTHPSRRQWFRSTQRLCHQQVSRQSSSYSSCRNSPPECGRERPAPARPESRL